MKVQFFGYVAERAGRAALEVPDVSTVRDAVDAVKRALPSLASLDASVRYAVNTEYADLKTRLKPGDVVSFIPPVGGG